MPAPGVEHEQPVADFITAIGGIVDPIPNVDDFTCFINEFSAGCP